MKDDDRPLDADHILLAARDIHFECTKAYFETHETLDENSWREATDLLCVKLDDAEDIEKRAEAIRQKASSVSSH